MRPAPRGLDVIVYAERKHTANAHKTIRQQDMEEAVLDLLVIAGATILLTLCTWLLLRLLSWETKCNPAVYPMHGGVQVLEAEVRFAIFFSSAVFHLSTYVLYRPWSSLPWWG